MPGIELMHCPPDELDALFRLRASVWVNEGADRAAFSQGLWTDDRDAMRQHWIVVGAGEIVAGASFSVHASLRDVEEAAAYLAYGLPEAGPVAAPARVVIRRDWRGRGVLRMLLDAQDQAAFEAGAVLAVRQASSRMRVALVRRGWRHHGPSHHDRRFPLESFAVMSASLERLRA